MKRYTQALLLLVLAGAGGVAALSAGPRAARAQDRSAAAKGLVVARTWCARCHVVEAGQKTHALDAAPPFADVARDPKMTPARLRGFLGNPHGRMPTEPLSRDDLAALIAYIESLRQK